MKILFINTLKFGCIALGVMVVIAGGFIASQYRSMNQFVQDWETAQQSLRIGLFMEGYTTTLTRDDIRRVYERACYRQCHGEAVMLTTVLSPAGWIQVVERMRVKEGVTITGKEAEVIIQYLEESYPVTRSPYTYTVRKATHDMVWRNDRGEGDIYSDIIYATPEYLRSIGMAAQIDEYELDNYHVFIVSFTVHDGIVPPYNMDAISSLVVEGSGPINTTAPWTLRFETADKHHSESTIRFARSTVGNGSNNLELLIKDVGGVGVRRFMWELPFNFPPEVQVESINEDADE